MPASARKLAVLPAAPVAPAPNSLPVSRPTMPRAEQVLPYLQAMDAAGWYSNFGPLLMQFEARLQARFTDGAQVVTAGNATLAIGLALKSMGLRPGARVAIPAWTFVATAHAVLWAGYRPWLIDVDAATSMLDPLATERALADAPGPVDAVIPVMAHGAPIDLDAWVLFQDRTGVRVLIDAAAAFDVLDRAPLPAVVSLHATKALGVGEGGFFVSRDPVLNEAVRRMTGFGFMGDRVATIASTNAKLSEYAAAVGLAALDGWPGVRERYMRVAQRLRLALMGRPDAAFQSGWGLTWISSVCVVDLPAGSAETLADTLAEAGVATRRWWGEGCHREPAFAECERAAVPVTDALARSQLGLPFYSTMSDAEVDHLASALSQALDRL
ncbi:MAG: DegT/DnrJ/EryC1/StrS aminotransferase [Brevundimonas sp.]|nr:MAG: DegT/DnrJ/EryC1/StrS aminotransferase [Brevundimonas sp.]